MSTLTMPRMQTVKADNEMGKHAKGPRARNGNTYAVGAYLRTLREKANLNREPLVRSILTEANGNITMSNSTLLQIEKGSSKSVGHATIDAVRRAVGVDPYDISELLRLPIPEDDDEDGINASRLEGEARAIARRKMLGSTSEESLRELAQAGGRDIQRILRANDKERLIRLAARVADNPKALSILESVLKSLED